MNDRIRITPVRVINQHQDQLGVIPTRDALAMAREAGLDLVEVSPTETPPVCRIMDYGKHLYERKKRLKTGSAGHTITLKEIRLRPKTGEHDRDIKMKRARGFLDEGHKVQFTMLFRGRERFHRERGGVMFKSILEELGETVKVERMPGMEGRRMTMLVSPVKRTASGGQRAAAGSKTVQPKAPVPTKAAVSAEQAPASDSGSAGK